MDYQFTIKCEDCNIEYIIDYNSPENVHSTYVICPKCNKRIYFSSDFGFGPVWPSYMYRGNDLFLIINFLSDDKYELKDKFNMEKKIVIPQRYLKNNYENHFKILEFIHENIKSS